MSGRILGLDPGERRIGVALSDPLGIIAQPHSVIDRREQDLATELQRIIVTEDVIIIVVGLPVSLDGAEHAAAAKARAFADEVAAATGIVPVFADERFTSSVAESVLLESGASRQQRREVRDKVAAAVMLQGFLDSGRGAPDSDLEADDVS